MQSKNVVRALSVVAVFALAALAQAQSTAPASKSRLQRVLETGVLRVGTTGDFRPMTFRDAKTNEYAGHDIEVARELAKDLGVKLEFVPTEWKTLINGIQTDKYDVAMSGISMNVDRAKVAAFTVPYMEFGTVPVVRKKDAAKFKSWSDLDKANVTSPRRSARYSISRRRNTSRPRSAGRSSRPRCRTRRCSPAGRRPASPATSKRRRWCRPTPSSPSCRSTARGAAARPACSLRRTTWCGLTS